jgi:hypothetical protein
VGVISHVKGKRIGLTLQEARRAGRRVTCRRSLAMPVDVGRKECLSCRIVGSATFAGVGIYALAQTRRSAPGSLAQKRIVGGLGVGT